MIRIWSMMVLMVWCGLGLAFSQELPRRPHLGIAMANLTDTVPGLRGVRIEEVFPNSTAEAAKWREGDVLTRMNGKAISNIDDVISQLAAMEGGRSFSYELVRNGKPVKGNTRLKLRPVESHPGITMEYGSFTSPVGLHRMIIGRPEASGGRPLPVMIFIGGMGCYSLDLFNDTTRGEVQMLNLLTRNGYMTVRAEKPGVGDGTKTSKACKETSLHEEMESYVHLVKQLKLRADVDSNDISVFGHSMGGVMAPLMAAHTPIHRIIAYGTFGTSLIEYWPKTRRTVGEAYGWPMDSIETYARVSTECNAWYFSHGLRYEEAAAQRPECAEYILTGVRSHDYLDQLYRINMASLWKDYGGKALFMWGESDYIASKDDHEILAAVMKRHAPGTGTFRSIPATDHGLNTAADFRTAAGSRGPYNPEVGNIILEWMKSGR
jgi:uncharacterized protein